MNQETKAAGPPVHTPRIMRRVNVNFTDADLLAVKKIEAAKGITGLGNTVRYCIRNVARSLKAE